MTTEMVVREAYLDWHKMYYGWTPLEVGDIDDEIAIAHLVDLIVMRLKEAKKC